MRTCRRGDAIVALAHGRHHANVVPWQILAAERASNCAGSAHADFGLDLTDLDEPPTASCWRSARSSNVLGTINDIRPLADAAHAGGALVLVDVCQYVPHVATDVQRWDADFVAVSSHKTWLERDRRPLGPRTSCSTRCPRSSAAAR